MSELSGTTFSHAVGSVAAYDYLTGRPLNSLEKAAVGVVAVEGACDLLYCIAICCTNEQTKRENKAHNYCGNLYVSEEGQAEAVKGYFRKHNKFLNAAVILYTQDEIDFTRFKELCDEATRMFTAFKGNPINIDDAFIAQFEKNTYVPNKTFWEDLINALIFSLKIAVPAMVLLTIISAVTAPAIGAIFCGWMTGVLIPSLKLAAVTGATHLLINSFWSDRGNFSAASNELTASVKTAATASANH